MFQILFYLYENYHAPQACPKPEVLAHKLVDAGFDHDEINAALYWLHNLDDAIGRTTDLHPVRPADQVPLRVYIPEELDLLSKEALAFIYFLESSGAMEPALREILIECALEESEIEPIGLPELKILALMVLWSQEVVIEQYIYNQLVSLDSKRQLH